jgi:hypothetical protein
MNVKKSKVNRISRQPFLLLIVTDQKQPENVKCGMWNVFSCLCSMITGDARCTRECHGKSSVQQ